MNVNEKTEKHLSTIKTILVILLIIAVLAVSKISGKVSIQILLSLPIYGNRLKNTGASSSKPLPKATMT